ncbi:MAG: glycosyltransferase family 9 protein [Candidatus Dadabacteria bacterium]|nr:glycosyltransferase family 9 protein [Candidatus Dadabacteria bacterium]NIV41580.1 glycosyltransferase family 9 protein [Candidatus Dadabacteria bacterium]NIX15142.1 glycosyltransferase family 9 protein [Candidatus Dadabacteria bacterium]NIY21787.1 glycosyltransferase family 9 protein [Candidatus Dadabacteria bacterium]
MKFKIQILKRIDALIGKPAVYLSRIVRPRKSELFSLQDFQNPESRSFDKLRILVIRPGGIGDAALLFPALKVLGSIYRNCRIDILAEKRNQGIFENCEFINELILYDNRPAESLSKVLGRKYDVVIDTEQWHRLTSVIAYLTRAPVRIGYSTNERSKLFTHQVSYSHEDYESQSFLNLVSALSKDTYNFDPDRAFIPVNYDLPAELSKQLNEYSSGWNKIAGIFSGATVAERMWGIDRFIETAKQLLDRNIGVVVLGASSEIADSAKLETAVNADKILNLTDKTTLYQTALVISRLNLFISADTGLMHIAYGVGTPTVSLFGAGIENKWGPKGENHINLNKQLTCSPCTRFGYTPSCAIDVKCLRDISASEVVSSAEKLLGSN